MIGRRTQNGRADTFGLGGPAWAVLGIAALALACGADEGGGEAVKGHPHAAAKFLKYARGKDVVQTFQASSSKAALPLEAWGGVAESAVQKLAVAAAGPTEAKLTFRLRAVSHVPGANAAAATGSGANAIAAAGTSAKLSKFAYDTYHQGKRLSNASRSVITDHGKVAAIRDRNLATALTFGPATSDVAWPDARDAGLKHAEGNYREMYPAAPVLLTVSSNETRAPVLEYLVNATDKRANLAWHFTVTSTQRTQPFNRRYWVAAVGRAEILRYEDDIFFAATLGHAAVHGPLTRGARAALGAADAPAAAADKKDAAAPPAAAVAISGLVTAMVWETTPFGNVKSVPLANVTVVATQQGIKKQTVTGGDGKYMFPAMQGPALVEATLSGPLCRVINESGNHHVLQVKKLGQGTVDLAFQTMNVEAELAQMSAFYHVNRAFQFVRPYLPTTPIKLARVATHVNVNQNCNAFWDPNDNSLNLFRKATVGNCPNTAYSDIMYHEYGHGVDDELGGILDGGYSEGFGDALAILITRQPIIGRDFFGQGDHLRDARHDKTWPMVQDSDDPHEVGEAYNGFVWDLIQGLQKKYPGNESKVYGVAQELVLGAGSLNPKDIPDAVNLGFFVDEKVFPGGAGQPSQHFNELKQAADRRSIPLPQQPAALQ